MLRLIVDYSAVLTMSFPLCHMRSPTAAFSPKWRSVKMTKITERSIRGCRVGFLSQHWRVVWLEVVTESPGLWYHSVSSAAPFYPPHPLCCLLTSLFLLPILIYEIQDTKKKKVSRLMNNTIQLENRPKSLSATSLAFYISACVAFTHQLHYIVLLS